MQESVRYYIDRVNIDIRKFGSEILIEIITPDYNHIGALALAIPYLKSNSGQFETETESGSAAVSVLSAPGHQDYHWAGRLAESASRLSGKTVSVLMGVHFDFGVFSVRPDFEQLYQLLWQRVRTKLEQVDSVN